MNNQIKPNQILANKEKHTQIFALVAALILAAVLASGCSTPPVQGTVNKNDDAGVSYTNCVQVMTAYGAQNQCYAVGGTSAQSYTQYSYGVTGFAKGVTQDNTDAAYKAYLSSLDQDSLNEMNAKWDAIAAANSK